MEQLRQDILDSRNIKPNTLRAYLINIRKLHEKAQPDKEFTNIKFLKDFDKITGILEDMKISTKKNYVASIIVALSTKPDFYEKPLKQYRDYLDGIAKLYKEQQEEQTKSEKEKDNWVSLQKLRKVMNGYKREIMERDLLKKDPEKLTKKEFDLIQKWVASSLYLMDDNPPMRLDYIMKTISRTDYDKLSESQKKEQNYLVVSSRNKKFFSFGEYKTAKQYGTKTIPVGSKLNTILNVWLKINKSGHLLLNSKGDPMTSNGLTKYLNKVFSPSGKSNISATQLRHIFISEKVGGPTLKEKKELASKMAHSTSQQELYNKK
jgi:integrase